MYKINNLNSSNESNKLKIKSIAGLIFYYVNDSLVSKSSQRYPRGNKLCLYVAGKQEIWFNYLKYRQLSKPEINLITDPDTTTISVNLGKNINTKGSEVTPFATPDGKGLFFTKKISEKDNDIFYSEIDKEGNYLKAIRMPFPLNNKGFNTVIASSVDGNILILSNQYKDKVDGTPGLTLPEVIKIQFFSS